MCDMKCLKKELKEFSYILTNFKCILNISVNLFSVHYRKLLKKKVFYLKNKSKASY